MQLAHIVTVVWQTPWTRHYCLGHSYDSFSELLGPRIWQLPGASRLFDRSVLGTTRMSVNYHEMGRGNKTAGAAPSQQNQYGSDALVAALKAQYCTFAHSPSTRFPMSCHNRPDRNLPASLWNSSFLCGTNFYYIIRMKLSACHFKHHVWWGWKGFVLGSQLPGWCAEVTWRTQVKGQECGTVININHKYTHVRDAHSREWNNCVNVGSSKSITPDK